MREIIVDGNDFNNYNKAYIVFRDAVSSGKEKNNDSMRDIIKRYTNTEEEVVLIWNNSEKSRRDLSYAATTEYYKRKLQYEQFSSLLDIIVKIKESEEKKGQTLFDMMVESFVINGVNVVFK